jgi:hypothetical protein
MTNYLSQKAMLSSLTISQWAARRLDKQVTDEVNESHGAVKDAGRYNKLLVDKTALEPIQRVVSAARTYHATRTQPWLDHADSRILPSALYLSYAEQMQKFRHDFEREVSRFCDEFPKHVERRKAALNGLFKDSDYPSESKIRDLFSFEVTILPCPDAADFRTDLAAEHAEDIKRGIERKMQTALSEAMQEPVRRIIDTVGRMAERLRAYRPAEGKGDKAEGVFRDTLVQNVRDLVDLLPAFNLTGDADLTKITARMHDELCREDADVLRENVTVREAVAKSAEDILAQAKQFMM